MRQMKRKTALFMALVMLACVWTSVGRPVGAAGLSVTEETAESSVAESVKETEATEAAKETAETTEEESREEESREPEEKPGETEGAGETKPENRPEDSGEIETEGPEETGGSPGQETEIVPETASEGETASSEAEESLPEEAALYEVAMPSISYRVHMQSYGWLAEGANGAANGVTDQGKRLEAIRLKVSGAANLGVEYQVYGAGSGWLSEGSCQDDQGMAAAGTTGQAKRVEVVRASLTGSAAGNYDLYYQVYVNNRWLDWAKNGESAGVDSSWDKSIEAVRFVLRAKGDAAPGPTAKPYLKFSPEDGYPNTHVNTGDRVRDIIAVAKTQAGYYKPGDTPTKYGTWYNGYINATGDYYPSAPWCAMFVSWCAEQAGIPSGVFKRHSYTVTMALWYQNENNPGYWHERGGYTPQPGDLIFFKFDWNDNYVNHVGIVTKVSGGKVYTIEGNTSDSVREKSYALTSPYIKGYATPDYKETGIKVPESAKISYEANVEGSGWESWKADGAPAGTTGSAKKLKGLKVLLSDRGISGGVTYRSHVQSYGWTGWVSDGAVTGVTNEDKRMEAVEIRLTGNAASQYDIYYRVHVQSYGWLDWAKNGGSAGSEGYAKRVEAIEILLVEKGQAAPGSTANPFVAKPPTVAYSTHCQTYGWLPASENGVMNGTEGQAKRLEGIVISLDRISGSVSYRTHVQTFGWQDWKKDGEMAGTEGLYKRLEAIEIRLSGQAAAQYDIYYRVHAQSFGWMGWAKNGESAGSSGLAKRLEAIEIRLVPKGGAAPGSTYGHYVAG